MPEQNRAWTIPGGKGGLGQANVRYLYDEKGQKTSDAEWVNEALSYVSGYRAFESQTESETNDAASIGIERDAGFQSNPLIPEGDRNLFDGLARRELTKLGFNLKDTHKTESYDFLCVKEGQELYVEVKGTQGDGWSVALTPNEVKHALEHKNSALLIVHSVKVTATAKPSVSGQHGGLSQSVEPVEGRPQGNRVFLFPFTHQKSPKLDHGPFQRATPRRGGRFLTFLPAKIERILRSKMNFVV